MEKFLIRKRPLDDSPVSSNTLALPSVSPDKCEPPAKKQKIVKRLVTFRLDWLKDFPFLKRSDRGNTYALCTTCDLHFVISHGGRDDIKRHSKTAGHIKLSESSKSNRTISEFVSTSFDESLIRSEVIFTKVGNHYLYYL